MKKFVTTMVAIIIALGLYVHLGSADSFAIGQYKLNGAVIDLEKQAIVASGKAKLTAPNAVINADKIKLDLAAKGGGVTKGTATGHVVIHARQVDAAGSSRIIDATAQSASLQQGQNTLVLNGGVVVRVTDPEQLSEPATLTGDTVTVFLKENRIRAENSSGKQPELVVTPKENQP